MTILVTGTSGFIGSNLTQYLIRSKKKFFGIDRINNPYFKFKNFAKIDLQNKSRIEKIIKKRNYKCYSSCCDLRFCELS